MTDWFQLRNPDEADSPALLVYPDRIRRNIQEMIRIAGDTNRLMPHVKTNKMAEVVRLQMAAGIHAFKCATIAEAEMLAIAGASKVLMAYQLNKSKAERFLHLIKKYPESHFASLVDNDASAHLLNELSRADGIKTTIYIDVDNGMHRTGIFVNADVADFYSRLNSLSNIRCVGLHVYDGHIHDSDFEKRMKAVHEAFEPVNKIIGEIEKKGFASPEIVAGGSPTFPVHALNKRVICSPGTNVFWDRGYHDILPDQHFEYAAALLTRIVSKPMQNIITVDLGHKSVASENPLTKRVYFLNLDSYEPVSQNEEHLVLKVKVADWQRLNVGDVFYGIPHHICPTVALYDTAQVIENGEVTGQWRVVARDRKINV